MTSAEFYQKVRAFMKNNVDLVFVIEGINSEGSGRQAQAKERWLHYLDQNGLTRTAQVWRYIWSQSKAVTVPAENPAIFDLKYVPASRDGLGAPKTGQGRQWRDPSDGNHREVADGRQ
jgi:hypothetical protein